MYNATLLQTPDFKEAIGTAIVLSFFTPVVLHVQAPTASPSLVPTVTFSENSVGGSSEAFTIGMSAAFGFLFIGMLDYISFILYLLFSDDFSFCSVGRFVCGVFLQER